MTGGGAAGASPAPTRLGLRENAPQFALLVLVNAFVGAMVGVERSVLPLIGAADFGVTSATVMLGFLVSFGLTKAAANWVAGVAAERVGRRRLLLLGWLVGLPVPAMLLWAPSWSWIVAANVLLGANQGLAWSATVIMKIDLAGPRQRGLAMGLNEFAGYLAVALAALAAGYLATVVGPREAAAGIGFGAALAGLGVSALFVRDTGAHVAHEHAAAVDAGAAVEPAAARRGRFAADQAGFVNNLNDGVAWGLLPLHFAAAGLDARAIGWLAALYPAVWGVAQIGTGALSDVASRRALITGGMLLQAAALVAIALASRFAPWAAAAVALGLGTAAVYPTLIAQVSDLSAPRARARAIGRYRLWRDLGYVGGALLAGAVADALGLRAAILVVAALTALSGAAAALLLPSRTRVAGVGESTRGEGAPV